VKLPYAQPSEIIDRDLNAVSEYNDYIFVHSLLQRQSMRAVIFETFAGFQSKA